LGHYPEVAAGSDQRLFEKANIVHRAEIWAFFSGKVAAEVEDGITDELTWAVVRNVSTAIDLEQFNSAPCKQLVAGKDVGAMGVAAKG
jgi:hypothetical protein